mgnify:FL=1
MILKIVREKGGGGVVRKMSIIDIFLTTPLHDNNLMQYSTHNSGENQVRLISTETRILLTKCICNTTSGIFLNKACNLKDINSPFISSHATQRSTILILLNKFTCTQHKLAPDKGKNRLYVVFSHLFTNRSP